MKTKHITTSIILGIIGSISAQQSAQQSAQPAAGEVMTTRDNKLHVGLPLGWNQVASGNRSIEWAAVKSDGKTTLNVCVIKQKEILSKVIPLIINALPKDARINQDEFITASNIKGSKLTVVAPLKATNSQQNTNKSVFQYYYLLPTANGTYAIIGTSSTVNNEDAPEMLFDLIAKTATIN